MTPSEVQLDRRRNAIRDDIADAALEGRVTPRRFVDGAPWFVSAAQTPVYPRPDAGRDRDTEALSGEAVAVFEVRDGWAWVQLAHDRYVGFVAAGDLSPGRPPEPTHVVTSPNALIYAEPTARAPAVAISYLTTRLRARPATESFLELETGGFIGRPHVATLGDREADFVATAETLLRAPYLWGGKTVRGVDCSGLVQLCLDRAGIDCPRDTDMQQAELPGDLELDAETLPPLRRGDLVYWPGHVAIMIDELRAIHATAYVMSVTVEPVLDVAARARGDGPIATAVKRVGHDPS